MEGSPGSSSGGTKITVGGVEVSEWNADNKVDKVTSTSAYNRVYCVTSNGAQSVQEMDSDWYRYGETSIPIRDKGGELHTPTPTTDTSCATKKYVDDAIDAISSAGGPTTIDISRTSEGEGKGDLFWSLESDIGTLLNTLMSSKKLVHLTLINDNEESMVIPLPPLGDVTNMYSTLTFSVIDPKGVIIQLDWYGDYKGFEIYYRDYDSTSWFYQFSQLAVDGEDIMYLTY